jgi:precorrin-4/cobalt-precorrin-4 C11-methyltransferase
VIPGVTAALASAAMANLELTLPELTQTLIVTRAEGRTPVPTGEDLESLCAHRASLALYLSAAHGERVSKALSGAYGPDAPVLVFHKATWPGQKMIATTAKELPEALESEGIGRHALILAGPAVAAKLGGGEIPFKSKLYDPAFTHGRRKAK